MLYYLIIAILLTLVGRTSAYPQVNIRLKIADSLILLISNKMARVDFDNPNEISLNF